MRITLHFFFVIWASLFLQQVQAQTPIHAWSISLSNSGNVFVTDFKVDAQQNTYAVGTFEGTCDFDPSAGTNSFTTLGNKDMFCAKYDANGALLWVKVYGNTSSNTMSSIDIAPNGNIIIGGYSTGSIDFAGQVVNFNSSNSDMFLLSLSPGTGSFVWVSSLNSISQLSEIIRDIAVAPTGEIYVVGYRIQSGESAAFMVIKVNSTGSAVTWSNYYGGNADDIANKVVVGPDGNIHVVGYYKHPLTGTRTVTFGTIIFSPTYTLEAGKEAIYLKIDPSGTILSALKCSSLGTEDEALDIYVDSNEDVYIAGKYHAYNGSVSLMGLTAPQVPDNDPNGFILKLGAVFGTSWVKVFTHPTNATSVSSIAIDAAGKVNAIGGGSTNTDLDPGAASFPLAGGNAFLIRLNSDGTFYDANIFNNVVSAEIQCHTSGAIYTGGYYSNSSNDFDPGTGTVILPNSGAADGFLSRLNTCATPTIASTSNVQRCGPGSVVLTASASAGTLQWFSDQISTTPVFSGANYTVNIPLGTSTYWVEAVDGACRSSREPAYATADAIPTITSVTNDTVCGPDVVILSATSNSASANLLWYTQLSGGLFVSVGPTFTPNITATTNYYVEASDVCTSTTRTLVRGIVNAIPTANISLNNQTLTATAVSGATYQWINCATNQAIAGATSQTYTATSNGSYAVEVTKSGCSATSSCLSVLTVGLESFGTASLQLFPNPIQQNAELRFDAVQSNLTINIIDPLGRLVQSHLFDGQVFTFNRAQLGNGLYLMQISDQHGYMKTLPFILN